MVRAWGWGNRGRENIIQAAGREVPTSCAPEDLGIWNPKPLALSLLLGGPHQPVSWLCPSQHILLGTQS